MHLILAVMISIISFYKGNWKDISKYHSTIFYVINLNLLYEFLCSDKLLWVYSPDFYSETKTLTSLLYFFIILPSITLLYLSNFPFEESYRKQIIYILQWILISFLIEIIYIYFDKIELQNGYKYWMEPFFYLTMYSMIRLHFTRPLMTYGISAIIIIILINIFNIHLR